MEKDYQYFKIYFDVLARQQNIERLGLTSSKIKSGNFFIDCSDNEDYVILEMEFEEEKIKLYINYDSILEFSFNSFIKTDYFALICQYLKTSYEEIIRIGKDYDEKYQKNLKPSIFSQYFITQVLTGPTGDELEVSIDFLRNRFYLKTSSESIHDTPLDDIILMERCDYEDMKRQVEDYKRLVEVLSSQSITKLDNGYVIENRYYEDLDRFLEERKEDK